MLRRLGAIGGQCSSRHPVPMPRKRARDRRLRRRGGSTWATCRVRQSLRVGVPLLRLDIGTVVPRRRNAVQTWAGDPARPISSDLRPRPSRSLLEPFRHISLHVLLQPPGSQLTHSADRRCRPCGRHIIHVLLHLCPVLEDHLETHEIAADVVVGASVRDFRPFT